VAVTGATALPTAHGAEVLFTLSAPAEVNIEVLNVAGRRVAALPTTLASSGLQRVPWGGRTTAGTGAPAGAYLVRITARGVGGGESGGLARLSLR
jgi:flagellar hook assembly protein FlgD